MLNMDHSKWYNTKYEEKVQVTPQSESLRALILRSPGPKTSTLVKAPSLRPLGGVDLSPGSISTALPRRASVPLRWRR